MTVRMRSATALRPRRRWREEAARIAHPHGGRGDRRDESRHQDAGQAASTLSPAVWPKVSLTFLKWSTSSRMRESGIKRRAARENPACNASWKRLRFFKPVRSSVVVRSVSRAMCLSRVPLASKRRCAPQCGRPPARVERFDEHVVRAGVPRLAFDPVGAVDGKDHVVIGVPACPRIRRHSSGPASSGMRRVREHYLTAALLINRNASSPALAMSTSWPQVSNIL